MVSWDLMCPTGPLWTWGGDQVQLEEQGSLWPPPVQHLWHEEGHLIHLQSGVLPQSHLSEISFLLAYGVLENGRALCDCFVLIRREGQKKPPWRFVVYVAWENTARPHTTLILKAYMQKFETGGFVDPGRKSRFQTGAQGKKPLVPSIFAFALLMNGCSLPVSWFCPAHVLNLHKLYFWAIIISRPSCKVGSWGASILSFTEFLSFGSCFWAEILWCRL